jgi:PKD repeat protein
VQFTDASTGTPTAWAWTFGDGNTSTLQNPSHTYTELGTYTVTLTATNAYGEDTETKTNYVTLEVPWAPTFTASPTTGAAPLTVQFTDTSTEEPFDWWWEFGDGDEVFSVQHPAHTYTEPGTYTVIFHAVNRDEEAGEVTREGYITVSAAPTPTLSPTPTTPPSSAHPLPYSQQRKDTMGFLLMCWGALAFVGVFCVVIFLLMNGAQRGSGGI